MVVCGVWFTVGIETAITASPEESSCCPHKSRCESPKTETNQEAELSLKALTTKPDQKNEELKNTTKSIFDFLVLEEFSWRVIKSSTQKIQQ